MHPVKHPTYLADIRFLFENEDTGGCMAKRGIDLRTFKGVKTHAQRIHFQLYEGSMPPGKPWPKEKVKTFYNWMRDGCPRGHAGQVASLRLAASTAGRMRRDIADYSEGSEELGKLRKAFSGIMELDKTEPDNPNGYFNLAGLHWLPAPFYCRHHDYAYNPWHRVYIQRFENALRSVDGCEDVTLPYWNIASGEIPDVLLKPPFDKYEFPRDLRQPDGGVFKRKGESTERFDTKTISENLKVYKVNDDIEEALSAGRWEDFNGWHLDCSKHKVIHKAIIAAHDSGHNACGPTMSAQSWAAFDPLFWFFHCNWDRLWWRWQQIYGGTNLEDFKTLMDDEHCWLTDPVLNGLKPFDVGASQTIDLIGDMNADYVHPAGEEIPAARIPLVASDRSGDGLRVVDLDRFLVTVSGINRLEIPGSFDIVLTADDVTIAKRAVFQPPEPKLCDTCRKRGVFSTMFEVDLSAIKGRQLAVRIDMIESTQGMARFPLSQAGDPEISVRLKMTS